MTGLADRVRGLLDEAVAALEGEPEAERLRTVRARLDEPLRVAIAGKMKAGKSTLLNALVGERLAPTDAGECTRIVTWYCDSHTSRVIAELDDGGRRQVPFTRDDGSLVLLLGDVDPDAIERLVVDWPSPALREITLIDTPGIDSLSLDVSARTYGFLAPDDDGDTPADAVVYLMRHMHASDLRFLEAFHDDDLARATPVNAVGVLSRADEIGAGRLDAMATSARIAARYRVDPKIRRLCQTVVPVAGLLAESAMTLRQDEFAAFKALAAGGTATDDLLLSADRFVTDREGLGVPLDPERRTALIWRYGMFGVRLAVDVIRRGEATTADQLAVTLRRHSGLDELRAVLAEQLGGRRHLLKARAAMAAADDVLRSAPGAAAEALRGDLERIEAGAHELAEMRLLNVLRAGALDLPDAEEAERLLGAAGAAPHQRLGLAADADDGALSSVAADRIALWQQRAESPFTARPVADAARILIRSCEGILAEAVSRAGSPGPPHRR